MLDYLPKFPIRWRNPWAKLTRTILHQLECHCTFTKTWAFRGGSTAMCVSGHFQVGEISAGNRFFNNSQNQLMLRNTSCCSNGSFRADESETREHLTPMLKPSVLFYYRAWTKSERRYRNNQSQSDWQGSLLYCKKNSTALKFEQLTKDFETFQKPPV